MKILLLAASLFFLLFEANGQILNLPTQTVAENVKQAAERELPKLKSTDAATRRDALHNLRLQENAVAAQIAATALRDKSEIVRATACAAVAYGSDEDAAQFLTPLLLPPEKSEFVRREAAFALGEAHSKTAVPALVKSLQTDKKSSVRAAVAIALGKISDERAIESLSNLLLLPNTKKNRRVVDEFVRRSAARALGEIRNKQAVPVLIRVLRDDSNADDVRREAAFALGTIADQMAVAVLQENIRATDYLLAAIAADALQKIALSTKVKEIVEKSVD